MEETQFRKERIKALISGKKLMSILAVIDRQYNAATGKEMRSTLSKTEFYDPEQDGDIEIEIIYSKKQIKNETD